MADNSIHVVVADDHPLIRMAVESALDSIPALVHVGSAADSTELIALLDEHPCDVLVTDYAMPGGAHGDGLPLLHLLRERYPELQIVVCLMQAEGRTVRRSSLEQAAWGLSDAVTPNALDVALHRLRRKLRAIGSKQQIVNIRGVGYALRDNASFQ